ncbi:MAG: hypothetical protein J6Q38_02825 [Clostridia bacterium]|nr:hypothetical protein [Clostridia bacterium]
MANKFRPSGSYKDYLSLTSDDISQLSENALKGVVIKLNEAANKRIGRMSKKGLGFLSPSYRGREGAQFKLTGKEDAKDLKAAYLEVRQYLNAKTSTWFGTRAYNKTFAETYENILDDPKYFDKRYKTKKVLTKAGKKRIRAFWEEYEKWKEIAVKKYPSKYKGDTNINFVEAFEEELYSKGKTNLQDYEKEAQKQYEEGESKLLEGQTDNEQTNNIQPSSPKRTAKGVSKQNKHKNQGIKVKFEKIKIFD